MYTYIYIYIYIYHINIIHIILIYLNGIAIPIATAVDDRPQAEKAVNAAVEVPCPDSESGYEKRHYSCTVRNH